MAVDVSSSNAVQEPSAVSFSAGILASVWLNLDTLPATDAGNVTLQLSTFEFLNFDVRTNFTTGDTLLRITYDGASYLDWFTDVTLGSLTGAWHHVLYHLPLSGSAATDAQIWVDGTLQTASWDAAPTSWTIGAISSAGVLLGGSSGFSYAYDGQIAEAGLWDTATAPSSADISALSDGTGATRPGDLSSLSGSLVFYAPLESSYVLDTPTGTMSDVGTGSTSIVGAHPTMASAGPLTFDLGALELGVESQGADVAMAAPLAVGLGVLEVGADVQGPDLALDSALSVGLGGLDLGVEAQGAGLSVQAALALSLGSLEVGVVVQGPGVALGSPTTVELGALELGAETRGATVALQPALTIDLGALELAAETQGIDVDLGALTIDLGAIGLGIEAQGAGVELSSPVTITLGALTLDAESLGLDLALGTAQSISLGTLGVDVSVEGLAVLLATETQALISSAISAGGPRSSRLTAGGPVSARLEVTA